MKAVEEPIARYAPKSIPLFDDTNNGSVKANFSDPAFASNKVLPVHRWVPWIAGFSRQFVRDVLTDYLKKNGVVLDPFAGVGTTLVEAILQNHTAIGFEINPYAALASRTKTSAINVSLDILNTEILNFKAFYRAKLYTDYIAKNRAPQGFQTRAEFFSPKVLDKVLLFTDFVETISDNRVKDLFRLAFASTMVQFSNYSYEPSLGRRVSAGREEIMDAPVDTVILMKLAQMRHDIEWLNIQLDGSKPNARVFEASFFEYENYLDSKSVDVIITSPPYLNNYHYNRNTRPQIYWLGMAQSPKDFKPLENANFGKYWQTVRELDSVELQFDLNDSDLHERLSLLRELNNEKGTYGGNGWANYAASYFNDCLTFARGIKYSLKRGGRAFVVIGNSILQGVFIPTDVYFAEIAESIGLELVEINIPRATRVGNSIISSDVRVSKAQTSDKLYEAIVVLRKK